MPLPDWDLGTGEPRSDLVVGKGKKGTQDDETEDTCRGDQEREAKGAE